MKFDRLREDLERSLVHLSVLNLEDLQIRIRSVLESRSQGDSSLPRKETVGDVEFLERLPNGESSRDGEGSRESEGVVLKVEGVEVGVESESSSESGDPFHSDTVLRESNDGEESMLSEGFGEEVGGSVLESVSTADDGSEAGGLTFGFGGESGLEESFGDDVSSCWTETVVVEDEVGEGEVGGEEGDDGFGASTSKGVVREVDGFQRGGVGERVTESGQSIWDLGNESTGEDVCEVGDLKRGKQWREGGRKERKGELSVFRAHHRHSSTRKTSHMKRNGRSTYLEILECRKNLSQSLASFDSQGVSSEVNLLDSLSESFESVQMRLDVLSGIEFESETLDGEGGGGVDHS